MRKTAFSLWFPRSFSARLGSAARELDQRWSAKNCRISSAPSEESDESQGRVSAPLRLFAENRSATPGGGGGGGVGVAFSLILSPSLFPSLNLSLFHSFSLSFPLAQKTHLLRGCQAEDQTRSASKRISG